MHIVYWLGELTMKLVPILLDFSLIVLFVTVVLGLAFRRGRDILYIGSTLTAIASVALLAIVILEFCRLLSTGSIIIFYTKTLTLIPIGIDELTLVLLTVISILGLATAFYTPKYMEYYHELGREGYFISLFSLFILSMALVVLSRDILWFLFLWEVMTLASYLLIVWEYTERQAVKAAWKYFVAMHFLSTLPLVLGIIYLWDITGSTLMNAVAFRVKGIPLENLIPLYILFIIGFASKAGIVPLHFWLPDAHPAAPSNISALLSGVMIKVAVYGLLRFCCLTLPMNTIVGYTIAFLGALSLTIGTLYALIQTDAKRLLAYHSVGQMGYIWLGLGAGIILLLEGNPLGYLGIVAGLYHLVNHAVFKGLLFLSAGAILYRTHTRDLNVLGGLGKLMPLTSLFTLIAALSIAGVPPFNGFLSKWLIYETTFSSMNGVLMFFGMLALFISAATLASFIKFYTVAFTGEVKVKVEGEVPQSMLIGMAILAVACIIWGVLPVTIIPLLSSTAQTLTYIPGLREVLMVTPILGVKVLYTGFSPVILIAMTGIMVAVIVFTLKPGASKAKPWTTGEDLAEHYGEYKLIAKHYYLSFEEALHTLYHTGEVLHHILYKAINGLAETLQALNYMISYASSVVAADFYKGIEGTIRALRVLGIKAITSVERVSIRIRNVGVTIYNRSREVYFDEVVIGPLTNILYSLARFLGWTVLRTDINTFLVYSALYVIALSVIVLLFMGLRMP